MITYTVGVNIFDLIERAIDCIITILDQREQR